MDNSDYPPDSGRPSPNRELQGPRPAPLKVRKDSYKAKKPPIAPQHRPPVIIYTVSPKVIHTNPSEFMSLVQRLTGATSSSVAPQSAAESMSPAAKLATIEKSSPAKIDIDVLDRLGIDMYSSSTGATSSGRAGILSPVPASLPTISPNFFSPPAADAANPFSFLPDLSPASFGNKTYVDNSFLISPSNLLSAQVAPSPSGYYWDLFNQYQDL